MHNRFSNPTSKTNLVSIYFEINWKMHKYLPPSYNCGEMRRSKLYTIVIEYLRYKFSNHQYEWWYYINLYEICLWFILLYYVPFLVELISFHIKPSTKNWRIIFQHLKKEIYNQWWWETLNPTLMPWFSVYQSHLNHHMHFFHFENMCGFCSLYHHLGFYCMYYWTYFFHDEKSWILKLGLLLNCTEKSLLNVSYDFVFCLVYDINDCITNT